MQAQLAAIRDQQATNQTAMQAQLANQTAIQEQQATIQNAMQAQLAAIREQQAAIQAPRAGSLPDIFRKIKRLFGI